MSLVLQAFPSVDGVAVALTEATNAKFGDYQCNAAMALCAVRRILQLVFIFAC